MVFVLAPFALLASLITFVTAVPAHVENRAPAQVFTQCTVPNTAALTFVSTSGVRRRVHSE